MMKLCTFVLLCVLAKHQGFASETGYVAAIEEQTCLNDVADPTCSVETETDVMDEKNSKNSSQNMQTVASEMAPMQCQDDKEECSEWAAEGECSRNEKFMSSYCRKSCNSCPKNYQVFENTWGEPQEAFGPLWTDIYNRITETEDYMLNHVYKETKYHSVRQECKNRDKLCSLWAVEGECQANRHFMQVHCAPACKSCQQVDYQIRCWYDDQAPKALGAGDLDAMFERIVTEPFFQKYHPIIHSKPEGQGLVLFNAVEEKTGPWLVELNNFLTDEECNHLVRLGTIQGFERSYDVGPKEFDGTYTPKESDERTSFNSWCIGECAESEVTKNILARMENVTGIPDENAEWLQILRYKRGQKYNLHHDYIRHDFQRPQGVRTITMFIYLSDVALGGETKFDNIDVTITPKKGNVLIWPNVKSDYPDGQEMRTHHQALPVEEGVKYAANLWYHQRDFKSPYYDRCN